MYQYPKGSLQAKSELMAEIDDPDLRLKLLHLRAAVVEADN